MQHAGLKGSRSLTVPYLRLAALVTLSGCVASGRSLGHGDSLDVAWTGRRAMAADSAEEKGDVDEDGLMNVRKRN